MGCSGEENFLCRALERKRRNEIEEARIRNFLATGESFLHARGRIIYRREGGSQRRRGWREIEEWQRRHQGEGNVVHS